MNNRRDRIRQFIKENKDTREMTDILISEGYTVGQKHLWDKMNKTTKFQKMNDIVRSEVSKLKNGKSKFIEFETDSVKRNILFKYINELESDAKSILKTTDRIKNLLNTQQIFLPVDILNGIQSLFSTLISIIELNYNPKSGEYIKKYARKKFNYLDDDNDDDKDEEIYLFTEKHTLNNEIYEFVELAEKFGKYLFLEKIQNEPVIKFTIIGKYELDVFADRIELKEITHEDTIKDFKNDRTRWELYDELRLFIYRNYIMGEISIGFKEFEYIDEIYQPPVFKFVCEQILPLKIEQLYNRELKKANDPYHRKNPKHI